MIAFGLHFYHKGELLKNRISIRVNLLGVSVFAALLGCKAVTSNVQEVTQFNQGAADDLTTFKITSEADKKLLDQFVKDMDSVAGLQYNSNWLDPAKVPPKVQNLLTEKKLDMRELAAVNVYTSNFYTKINHPLRTKDPVALKKFEAIIKVAASGLNKIPAISCRAKRGTNLPLDVIETITPSKKFVESAFMSTTVGTPFSGSVEFTVTSDNCKDVSWLSQYPNEREVLFPPGSEFVVTKKTACPDGDRQYCIELKHVPSSRQATVFPHVMTEEEASPGTKGMGVKYRESDFVGKKFLGETDSKKYIYFETTKKGKWVNSAGENTITDWILDKKSNIIEVSYNKVGKPDAKTKAYFYAMDLTEIGYMKGPKSQKIQESYRLKEK